MKNKNQVVEDSLNNLFSVSLENLLNLPCYVFWKNNEGVYLGYNDYGAINLGYNCGDEIAGRDDYEMFPSDIAELYRKNDQEVIAEKKQLFVPEKGFLKDKFPVVFLSYKMPLYDQNKVVIGLIGIAFTRPIMDVNCLATKMVSTNDLAQVCNACPPQIKSECYSLSEKEKLCLQCLCEGLTLKMTARRLGISPKTVETHIERAKIKMNCHNKAQLIFAFIKAYGGQGF